MKKRTIACIVIMMLLLGMMPAKAATDEAVFEVRALGILKGDENGELRLEDDVTRGEFAAIVVRMLGYEDLASAQYTMFKDVPENHIHSGAIALIDRLGFVSGDGNGYFYPDKSITVQECLKILVHSVGYEIAAQGKGGYPNGYVAIANQLELTKGLGRTLQQNATRGDVTEMVYHALYVDLLEQSYSYNGDFSKSGTTLKDRISFKEDIRHANGVVTANYNTWLVHPISDIEPDEIEVEGIRYNCGNVDSTKLIGRRVELYYREEASGKKTILNIALSDKNEETVVFEEDLGLFENGKLTYTDKNNHKDTVSFDSNVVYVYNNRVLTTYTQEDLHISQGRYECIDNNADNFCDYVFIYEYENSVVERVNPNGCIYLKNELLIDGKNYVAIDDDSERFKYKLCDAQGNTLSLEDVSKGNSITVYISKDKTFVHIVVSNNIINGKIEQMSDDEDIVIAGNSYGQSKNINTAMLVLGTDVIAYINEFNEIVYLEENDSENSRYGYVVACAKDGLSTYMAKIIVSGDVVNDVEIDETSDDEEEISVLLCKNSEVIIAELEKKVKFNGEKVSAEYVASNLNNNVPVKFKIAENGKISIVDEIPLEYGSVVTKMDYNAKDRIFGGISGVSPFGVDDNTKVICVPTNGSADEEDMLTQIKIDNRDASVRYLASGYERDEDSKCVKLLMIIADMVSDTALNITKNSEIGIVQKSFVKIDDGDELHIVEVLSGDGEVQLVAKEVSGDNGDTDYLKTGDFIIFETNVEGYLVNSKIIKSLSNNPRHNKASSGVTGSITGIVTNISRLEINNEKVSRVHVIDVLAGNTTYRVEIPARNIPDFYIYDKEINKSKLGSIDDIMYGDVVCISMPEDNVEDCVIVRSE